MNSKTSLQTRSHSSASKVSFVMFNSIAGIDYGKQFNQPINRLSSIYGGFRFEPNLHNLTVLIERDETRVVSVLRGSGAENLRHTLTEVVATAVGAGRFG